MLEQGQAPFCGNYPKCNNAEGCDICKEFTAYANKEFNKYILIRYDDILMQPVVEGYFPTVEEAKGFAEGLSRTDAFSLYELAGNCKDLI